MEKSTTSTEVFSDEKSLKRKFTEELSIDNKIFDLDWTNKQIRNQDKDLVKCFNDDPFNIYTTEIITSVCNKINNATENRQNDYIIKIKKKIERLVDLELEYKSDVLNDKKWKIKNIKEAIELYKKLNSRYKLWLKSKEIDNSINTEIYKKSGYYYGNIRSNLTAEDWLKENDEYGIIKIFSNKVINDGYKIDYKIDDIDYTDKKEYDYEVTLHVIVSC